MSSKTTWVIIIVLLIILGTYSNKLINENSEEQKTTLDDKFYESNSINVEGLKVGEMMKYFKLHAGQHVDMITPFGRETWYITPSGQHIQMKRTGLLVDVTTMEQVSEQVQYQMAREDHNISLKRPTSESSPDSSVKK